MGKGGGGDALVIIGADVSAVKKAAAEAVSAWKDVGRSISTEMGNATTSIINDLGRVVTAQGQVNFSSQLQQVREFETSTARMAVSTGRSFESVRTAAEATGVEIGRRPQEVQAWSNEVGRLTGNFQGAEKAIRGVAGFAAQTNRSVDDYRGLAVELQNVGHVGGDTTHALGVLTAQAQMLGTVGGPAALADQVMGLQDVISHFAVKSEADFLKVAAAAGVFGKGLNQAASQRVQQSILGMTTADPYLLKRMLGHEVVDKQGHVKDAVGTAFEIRDYIKKKYGSGSLGLATLARMPGMSYESASALMNANRSEAEAAAKAKPSQANQDALKRYLGSDAGGRDVAAAKLAESSRALLGSATALGRAADALQTFASNHPIASTVASTAAAGVLGAGAAAVGKSVTFGIRKAIATAVPAAGRGALTLGGATVAGIGTLLAAGAAGVYGEVKFYQATKERHYLERNAADSAAQGALEQRRIAMRKANAAARAVEGLTPGQRGAAVNATTEVIQHAKDSMTALQLSHGGGNAIQQLTAALKAQKNSALDDATIDKMAKALAAAMQGGTLHVTTDSEAPVVVTKKASHKTSAGNQAHP